MKLKKVIYILECFLGQIDPNERSCWMEGELSEIARNILPSFSGAHSKSDKPARQSRRWESGKETDF